MLIIFFYDYGNIYQHVVPSSNQGHNFGACFIFSYQEFNHRTLFHSFMFVTHCINTKWNEKKAKATCNKILCRIRLEPGIHLRQRQAFEIKQYIFNSNFGFYFNRQKQYKIQPKNIIMCCEFHAKMHLDAQNIKQFWYRASVLEFLLIAHAHLTTNDHTNSSTHIDILSVDAQARVHA